MSDEIIREYHASAFRGKVEDVPTAEGVDVEAIRQRDPDAVFVSLPIAEIGAISENGLLYDEALVDSIAEQINTRRVGGIFGHLKEDERSTSFPLPAGLWIGAKRFEQTLWAKSYVPPSQARDYVLNLKAVGGELATSIYGKGKRERVRDGVHRLSSFKLESLDYAPPQRAALGMGAVPHVTAELEQEQEPIMADKTIAELTVNDIPSIPQAVRDAIVSEAAKQSGQVDQIAELTNKVVAKDAVIAELQSTVEEMRRTRVLDAVDDRVAEITDWKVSSDEDKATLDNLRATIKKLAVMRLGEDFRIEKVAEFVAAAYEDMKPIAEVTRDRLAGPAAIVGGRQRASGGIPKLEDTPENRAAAASAMGIAV